MGLRAGYCSPLSEQLSVQAGRRRSEGGAETPVVGHGILSAADTPAVAPARGGSDREAPCPRRALGSRGGGRGRGLKS